MEDAVTARLSYGRLDLAQQPVRIRLNSTAPLVYTNVLVRNWSAFHKLGVERVHSPGGYHVDFALDFPVSLGSYRCPRTPEEPMLVHMVHVPTTPGLPVREQSRAGRWELLSTTFETLERRIRDQLGRTLAGGGFYEPNSLFDPEWAEDERPWVRGRQPFGAITIANSDAGASAYTNVAIDQAFRAVQEIAGIRASRALDSRRRDVPS